MINHHFSGVYAAPVCEISEKTLSELLCESPDGITEDFGDLVDFEW